jgi:hypothetical protein
MYILGIDPGKYTGLCLLSHTKDPKAIKETSFIASKTITDINLDSLTEWIEKYCTLKDIRIGMENLIVTGALTKGKIEQIQAITIVKELCRINNLKFNFITPENRLWGEKFIGNIFPTNIGDRHAKDAYKIAHTIIKFRSHSWQD